MMGFKTPQPLLLKEKGASLQTVGLALALVIVGGAGGKSSAGRNRGLDSGSPRVAGYGMSRVAAAARHYAQPGAFTAPCGGRLATAAPTATRQSDMQCCVSFSGLLAFGPPAEPHNIPEPRQEPIEP
jgi:hypothetical protein